MNIQPSIRGKLLAIFALIVALIVGGNIYTFRLLWQWDAAHMDAIEKEQLATFLAEREVDHLAWDVDLLTALLLEKDFQGGLDHTACALGKWYYSYTESEEFGALPEELQSKIALLEEPHKRLHQEAGTLLSMRESGVTLPQLLVYYQRSVEPNLNQVRRITGELRQDAQQQSHAAVELADAVEGKSVRSLLLVMIAVIVISITLVLALSSGINTTLKAVVGMAKDIARGDLSGSLEINTGDECETMASTINQFVAHVRDIVRGVRQSATFLNSTSHQVASAMDEMTAATQEVASAASEFAAHVQQVSFDATEMSKHAEEIVDSGQTGSKQLDEVLAKMGQIEMVVAELADSVKDLNNETVQIESITATISDIADQINLLALNAAIEAARAGEQGRGFAVVAEEIRRLAERSSAASGEIEALISKLSARSDDTLKNMEDGSQAVEDGAVAVQDTAKLLGGIITSVEEMSQRIQAIARAAEGLAAGSQEIAAATQEQSATVEEISSSSQMLATTADNLESSVQGIKTGNE